MGLNRVCNTCRTSGSRKVATRVLAPLNTPWHNTYAEQINVSTPRSNSMRAPNPPKTTPTTHPVPPLDIQRVSEARLRSIGEVIPNFTLVFFFFLFQFSTRIFAGLFYVLYLLFNEDALLSWDVFLGFFIVIVSIIIIVQVSGFVRILYRNAQAVLKYVLYFSKFKFGFLIAFVRVWKFGRQPGSSIYSERTHFCNEKNK